MALRTIREFGDEVLSNEDDASHKSTDQRHVRYHV